MDWVNQQRYLMGLKPKSKQNSSNLWSKRGVVKILLVEDAPEEKDEKQIQIDSYNKFKRKQERVNQRKVNNLAKKATFKNCSIEELYLL